MRVAAIVHLRWVLVYGLLLTAAGCAKWGGIPTLVRPEPEVTVEGLTASLRRDAKPVKTLWLRAQVIASKPGIPGKRHFEATILFEPPSRLRLRAYRNVSILVFDLLADDWGLRLWNPGDKSHYAADYARLRRNKSEWAGLEPSLVARGLLVEHTIAEELDRAKSAKVRRRWKTNELRLETDGAHVRVGFDRKSGRLVTVDYRPRNKALAARLRYGEMVKVEGVRLPRWVEIYHKRTRTRLRLEVSEYKVDRAFQREVFVPSWAIGVKKWLPLEVLR